MKNTQALDSTDRTGKARGTCSESSVATPIRVTAKKSDSPGKATKVASVTSTGADKAAREKKGDKVAQPKRKIEVSMIPDSDLQQMIQEQAYLRSERRGFVSGFEWQDWFEAEQEVYQMMKLEQANH